MHKVLRIAIALVGLLNLGLGLAFLYAPVRMAAEFSITAIGSQGLATIRADFPGFFITAGLFALLGLETNKRGALWVPVTLLGIAFVGRTLSLLLDGVGPDALPPMIAEAMMIAILIAGIRAKPQSAP
ncbi:hypothetical protein H9L15_03555 [Sphingomonas daechungensis]|uniref:DUF4345 domain-containing protein n=2 Tax=Sphingomonas daechungensis TaxID=1176646 RepID=A0ABX6T563_9SPHN|nr:hypothetical protein H9L15_03555 [Sphingomonas daechungensis]